MATASDLAAPLANLNLQDSTKLRLNVLTANIGKIQGNVETQKCILEYFFNENQPDCILIQENPWVEDKIKEHLKVIGENYNMTWTTRAQAMKTAVLCRYTSAPKLDHMRSITVPIKSRNTFTGWDRYGKTILERATIASFTVKDKRAGHSEPFLIMISWHGEHTQGDAIAKKGTIECLLGVVIYFHTKRFGRTVPVVLGGDFNLEYQTVKELIKRESGLKLVPCPVPSSRVKKKRIDFFIVTKDVQVDGAYAIPYEMDPDGKTFDHVPVMARLTFPTIDMKLKCDVLVKNLEKMLSKEAEPTTRCMCNKTECDINGVIHLLACHHTFHQQCLPADRSCLICTRGASSNELVCTLQSPVHPSSVLPRVIICPRTPYMSGLITCWHLFSSHSQSGIVLSKSRLNRDIVIMLALCRLFFDSCDIPDPSQPLSQSWIHRVIRGILIGNELCGRLIGSDALVEIDSIIIQKLKYALDVEPTIRTLLSWKKLSELIHGAVEGTETALICISEETTFAFVHFSKCVLLLDTHSHGTTGALVALASQDNAGELISWYKDFNKLDDTKMVRVRQVQYSRERLAVAAATLFRRDR